MDEIEIVGGGDCPEMSLSALNEGIKYGLPNSIVYVLTDATSKDVSKYDETSNSMKRKQSTVS